MKKKKGKAKKSKKIKIIILIVFILLVLGGGAYFTYDFLRVKDMTLTVNVLGVEENQTFKLKMGKIIDLNEPDIEGYDFKGWYYNKEFSKPFYPSKNFIFKKITLYAKMDIKTYTATFFSNGGNEIQPVIFEYNQTPQEPAMPNKADYMFAGWYTDSQFSMKYNFDVVINDNITLFADYTLISDSLSYVLEAGKMRISGFKSGISPYLYIPKIIDGYDVSIIGANAFKDCLTIKQAYIYEKDLTIESNIFSGCNALEKITIPLVDIGYTTRDNHIVMYYFNSVMPNSLKSITIIEGLTALNEHAFAWCTNVETINLPNSLVVIGDYAFFDCQSLKNIKIPDGVTSIGEAAFRNCYLLLSINIPDTIEIIRMETFSTCRSLKEIKLPEGILRIEMNAFYDCSMLEKINLPDGLEIIDDFAFQKCSKLNNIKVPASIKKIEQLVFYNCFSLNELELPEGLTTIDQYAFFGCTSLKNIYLPDSIAEIGEYAFFSCSSLGSVRLPSSLETLNDSVFSSCSSLSNITLNEGLKTIKTSAISNCLNLTKINIPSTVTSINLFAFGGSAINEMVFNSTTPPTINEMMYLEYLKIYVPDESLNAYKTATNWTQYSSFIYPKSSQK